MIFEVCIDWLNIEQFFEANQVADNEKLGNHHELSEMCKFTEDEELSRFLLQKLAVKILGKRLNR